MQQSSEEFVKFLGVGSFGSVDLIKYIKPDGSSFHAAVKTSAAEDYEILNREIQILKELKGYPSIVLSYGDELEEGFSDNGHKVYKLLLEYANEGSLSSFMDNYTERILPNPLIKDFTRMILEGLVSIHSHGYVHCDLKSDNLLIFSSKDSSSSSSYELKISDFGNCIEVGEVPEHWEIDYPFFGTPMYMPPESLRDGAAKKTLDLWSLGCVVLEMYTGKKPWTGFGVYDFESLLSDGEAPEIPECVPCDARAFIETCFAREPEKRGSASELLFHQFLCPKEKTKKTLLLGKLKLRIKRRASKQTMDIKEKPLKLKILPLKKRLNRLFKLKMIRPKDLDSCTVSVQ